MKNRRLNRPCLSCGKEFLPRRDTQKACSIKCRDKLTHLKTFDVDRKIKHCSKCKEWKPYELFVKSSKSPSGLHSYCKLCTSVWHHDRRGTPEEQRKEYKPLIILDEETKKQRKREKQKIYAKNNKEKVKMWNRLRHQKQRAAGKMPHRYEIGALLCSQDARCTYCKCLLSGNFHIDHKTPVSRGGLNDFENLQILCVKCNLSKNNKNHEEYLAILNKQNENLEQLG